MVADLGLLSTPLLANDCVSFDEVAKTVLAKSFNESMYKAKQLLPKVCDDDLTVTFIASLKKDKDYYQFFSNKVKNDLMYNIMAVSLMGSAKNVVMNKPENLSKELALFALFNEADDYDIIPDHYKESWQFKYSMFHEDWNEGLEKLNIKEGIDDKDSDLTKLICQVHHTDNYVYDDRNKKYIEENEIDCASLGFPPKKE
jgi:hypothetical protein